VTMDFRPLNVIGISTPDWGGRSLQLGTLSRINHVASIVPGKRGGLLWTESSATCTLPDLWENRIIKGVQFHPIEDRLAEEAAKGSTIWLYRLRSALTEEELRRATERAHSLHGRPYDYLGAWQARVPLGGTLRRWLLPLKRELHKLCCHEYTGAVVEATGRIGRINPSEWNPGALCRMLVAIGKYESPEWIGGRLSYWGRRINPT
jgi:hypothetical protein